MLRLKQVAGLTSKQGWVRGIMYHTPSNKTRKMTGALLVQEKYPNQDIPAPIQLLLWIFTPAPPGSPIWVVSPKPLP